jgi:hypothetical protein
MGVFEWNRVPMGLKGAPAYFQQVMATIVLAGLIYVTCELYLDDCIVYASTEEEFVERLRQLFLRFREHNITLNPDKVILGTREIEYVGHVLTTEGKYFTREKINQLIEITRPITAEQLKSFLGLANYFHSHIKNLSLLAVPLQRMIPNYTKKVAKKSLSWSDETITAFGQVVESIRNCPKLYFLDETSPIILETDACDYGIGAYLYQVVNGEQHPVSFISKALSGAQLNWSTPEKEAFAIYFAFIKLEHLIRDRKFTLKTDHRNLTFMDKGQGKILRCKLAIQEYNFDTIDYIPGPDNIVADSFSRLCVLTESELSMPVVSFAKVCTLTKQALLDNAFKIPEHVYKAISQIHNSQEGHFGEEITLKN